MKNKKISQNFVVLMGFILTFFALIIGTNILLKGPKETNRARESLKKYTSLLENNKIVKVENALKDEDPKTIKEKFLGYDKDNKLIATLYGAVKDNQYGSIYLRVIVDPEGKIIGISATVDQSYSPEKTKEYVEKYKNSLISEPKASDGSSGPTVKISVGTADEIIADIAKSHGIVKNAYDELFAKGYVLSDESDISDDTVKKFKTVSVDGKIVANVYTIEGEGLYITETGAEGSIQLQIILDSKSTRILGFVIDEKTYHHTWSYRSYLEKYLNKLISENVYIGGYTDKIIVVDEESGATSGNSASNTVLVAMKMLAGLKTYLGLTFAEKVEVNSDVVKTSQAFKDKDGNDFEIYYLEGEGVYDSHSGSSGSIGVYVVLDKDNKIIDISLPEAKYNHTKSKTYMNDVEKYIKMLVKDSVSIIHIKSISVDGESGATSSGNLSNTNLVIQELLSKLDAYKKGE